jgi:hypothetical protein
MKTIESMNPKIDRKDWGIGPWNNEPDKMQWQDAATGLACLAVRNDMGVWCGYVGIPEGHPWYGKGYEDLGDVDVHGGLTYGSAKCSGNIAT